MGTKPRINIISFTGGGNGSNLEKFHFVETAREEFLFHVPGLSPFSVVNGETFTFHYGDMTWTITFYYSDFTRHGQGNWLTHKNDDQNDPESGTFQAQAGPGAGADDDLSASASASA